MDEALLSVQREDRRRNVVKNDSGVGVGMGHHAPVCFTVEAKAGTADEANMPGPARRLSLQWLVCTSMHALTRTLAAGSCDTPAAAAQPKSMSVQEWCCGRHRMFPGLRSRCTKPAACSCCKRVATSHSTCTHRRPLSHSSSCAIQPRPCRVWPKGMLLPHHSGDAALWTCDYCSLPL